MERGAGLHHTLNFCGLTNSLVHWLSVSRQKEQSVRNAWQMHKKSSAKCEESGLKMRPLHTQDRDKRSVDMTTEHVAVR